MTDVGAFATGTPIEEQVTIARTFIAGAAITAGQVVCIPATGVSNTVVASVAEAGSKVVGVALTSAAANAKVNVCMLGICNVVNADDTATIDAGHYIICNDNAVKGTVSEVLAVGSATAPQDVIGYMIEDMAAGSYAKAFINTVPVTQHA